MVLDAKAEQHTRVCCAVCGAYGLWGYVVSFRWEYLDLTDVHVCPGCLGRWAVRSRTLSQRGCKSWDLLNGRGSRKEPNLERGYVALDMTPYVGASLMRTLWDLNGRHMDQRVSKGLVVLWLSSRGEIKLRRNAGRQGGDR